MTDVWRTWVGTKSVAEFMAEVDVQIAAGTYRHRFSAFLDYARKALAITPDPAQSPEELAANLLGHALDWMNRPP